MLALPWLIPRLCLQALLLWNSLWPNILKHLPLTLGSWGLRGLRLSLNFHMMQ